MAELNFPAGAMAGTSYTASNGITYIYDGFKWIGKETTSIAAYSLTNNGFTLAVQPTGNITIPNGKSILYENGDPLVTNSDSSSATIINYISPEVSSSIISNSATSVTANINSVDIQINGGNYWWAELGKFSDNSVGTRGVGVKYDNAGNLWTFGNLKYKDGSFVDLVLAKYDSNGSLVWANQLRDVNNVDTPYTSGTALAFNREGSPYYLASDLTNNITYIGKLTDSGNIVSQSAFSINGYAYDMVFDAANNLYIAGLTNDSARPYSIPFVLKFDEQYDIIWQKGIDIGDESSYGSFTAITIDSNFNSYVTGWYTDPGSGVNNALLVKLDIDGNLIWQRTIGIPSQPVNETGWSVQVLDQSVFTLVQDAQTQASVITRFDFAGNQMWQTILDSANVGAGTLLDQGANLTFDPDGFLYVTGAGHILGVQSLWIAKLESWSGIVIGQGQIAANIGNIMANDMSVTGHRQSDIFNNRIAITGYTNYRYSTSTVSTSTYGFVIQLPTDGSLTGTYNGINYVDVSSLLSSSVRAGTYTNLISNFSIVDTDISTINASGLRLDTLANSTLTSYTQAIATVGSNWKFNNTGTIIFPDGTEQVSAYTGQGAGTVAYNPTNALDWTGTPTVATFSEGLDELASRMIGVESLDLLNLTSDLIPGSNLAYDLGTIDKQWRSIYVGTGTIYIGGVALGVNQTDQVTVNGNPIITVNTAGNLTVQGNTNVVLGAVAISDMAPEATTPGSQWFNTVEARTYVAYNEQWVDASPTVLPPPDTNPTLESVTFNDATVQTTAWTGTYSYSNLTEKPVLFSGSYDDLTDKPTFVGGGGASTWLTAD